MDCLTACHKVSTGRNSDLTFKVSETWPGVLDSIFPSLHAPGGGFISSSNTPTNSHAKTKLAEMYPRVSVSCDKYKPILALHSLKQFW